MSALLKLSSAKAHASAFVSGSSQASGYGNGTRGQANVSEGMARMFENLGISGPDELNPYTMVVTFAAPQVVDQDNLKKKITSSIKLGAEYCVDYQLIERGLHIDLKEDGEAANAVFQKVAALFQELKRSEHIVDLPDHLDEELEMETEAKHQPPGGHALRHIRDCIKDNLKGVTKSLSTVSTLKRNLNAVKKQQEEQRSMFLRDLTSLREQLYRVQQGQKQADEVSFFVDVQKMLFAESTMALMDDQFVKQQGQIVEEQTLTISELRNRLGSVKNFLKNKSEQLDQVLNQMLTIKNQQKEISKSQVQSQMQDVLMEVF